MTKPQDPAVGSTQGPRSQSSTKPAGEYLISVLRSYTALFWGLLTITLVITALAIAKIMEPAAALVLAIAAIAIVLLASRVGNGVPLRWRTTQAKRRAGARDETSELSWMLFSRDNAISFGGNRYIRQVAQRAVMAAGLNLEDPTDQDACRNLLGTQVYAAITSANPDLTITDLEQILTTLEAILDIAKDPEQAPQQAPTKQPAKPLITDSAPAQRIPHA